MRSHHSNREPRVGRCYRRNRELRVGRCYRRNRELPVERYCLPNQELRVERCPPARSRPLSPWLQSASYRHPSRCRQAVHRIRNRVFNRPELNSAFGHRVHRGKNRVHKAMHRPDRRFWCHPLGKNIARVDR
jgi:hypothetical protein